MESLKKHWLLCTSIVLIASVSIAWFWYWTRPDIPQMQVDRIKHRMTKEQVIEIMGRNPDESEWVRSQSIGLIPSQQENCYWKNDDGSRSLVQFVHDKVVCWELQRYS